MPKNGFFFLFMAPVTTTAGEEEGTEAATAGKRPQTSQAPQQEELPDPASPAPRKQRSPAARSPAHSPPPPIPRAEVPENRLPAPAKGRGCGRRTRGAPDSGEACEPPSWRPPGATSSWKKTCRTSKLSLGHLYLLRAFDAFPRRPACMSGTHGPLPESA